MHIWGNGERLLLAACIGLSFLDIAAKEQCPIKGQKKRPALTASTANTYLSVVNIGNAPVQGIVTKSTVSSRVCWSLKVLWGSVSADFQQFQVGGEGKKERWIRD